MRVVVVGERAKGERQSGSGKKEVGEEVELSTLLVVESSIRRYGRE